jgi:hypothetical protein
MKALILRNDAAASLATAHALIDKGFQILSVDTQAVAHALIRMDVIDLLVMDERVEGQLTHAIALSAERKNPYLSAILLTDRTAEETDDLFELIPSLYGLVGQDTTPAILGKLALSAVTAEVRAAGAVEEEAVPELRQREPLLLLDAEMALLDNECEDVEIDYTEVAVAAPAMPEITLDVEMAMLAKECDDDEVDYADVAIAAPAMSEITMDAEKVLFNHAGDPMSAEVAALFRKTALPHFLQTPSPATAQAS